MLYFTGDLHGEYSRYLCLERYTGEKLTGDDFLFVCGDYGFLFYPVGSNEYTEQQRQLNEIEKLPYTTLFCDGNHENFDLLESYPVEVWNGGKVHRIRSNILHLMRGQVYNIDGTKVFSMGGAYSIDKYMRQSGYSWWSQERPNNDEYKEASANLVAAENNVDIIISHTAPREIIYRMGRVPDMHDAELTGFLEWIMYEVSFKKWYFGHWHIDQVITDKVRAIYFDVVRYEEKGSL